MDREYVGIRQATQKGYSDDLTERSTEVEEKASHNNMTKGDDEDKRNTSYRIRKLTEKECWRLMDFNDEDFEKAAKVNSRTQLYKQAGNSIVVNVLIAILGQLFIGKEDVYRDCKVKK